jgi:Zn-dependent protease with chaperone function
MISGRRRIYRWNSVRHAGSPRQPFTRPFHVLPLSLWLAVALALTPAAVSWWTGRSVLARVDDPVLPELLFDRRKRLASITLAGAIGLALLFRENLLWALPLLWIALLLTSHPLRRALFGERLGRLAFLRYAIFSTLGQIGVWLVAAAAPAVATSLALGLAPNDSALATRVAIASGLTLASIVAIWQHQYTRVFLALHRATPLGESAPASLMTRLDAILDRAAPALARRPAVYRYGAPGAYVMNALAIPSRRRPAIALGDSLLATLSDDEIAAVFAHEVAHHEQFNTVRWRRARWRAVLLIAIVAVLPTLLVTLLPAAALLLGWCVPVALLISLGRRAAARRSAETASDLRAVALTGSADALISALTKIHVYSRVPRRWPHAIERAATHPSLARRIQALRDATNAIQRPEAQVAAPLTAVRSLEGAEVVAFDRDRSYWFEGVPTDAPLELHALREAASTYRAVSYGDLAELRVGVAEGRYVEAIDHSGRTWRVAIAPNDVVPVQDALDRVDIKLGRRRPAAAAAGAVSIRWLALALLVMLMGAGELGIALIPILVVLLRPTMSAAVAAAAAMAVARALGALPVIGSADPVRQIALLLATSVAIVLVVQTARRVGVETAKGNGRRLTREAWTVAGGLCGLALVFGLSLSPLAMERPESLLSHPIALAIATLLGGAGGAALTIPSRWWRAGGAITTIAALGGGLVAGGDGWLVHRTTAVRWTPGHLTATGGVRIAGGGFMLTSSPDGQAFAVAQFLPAQRRQAGAARFLVGRFDSPGRAPRVSTAIKIAFLDGETLVALDTAAGDSLELRAESIAAPNGKPRVLWRERLPSVEDPHLLIDRSSRSWVVVGRGEGDWSFVVAHDTLGGAHPRLNPLTRRTEGDVGEVMMEPLAAFPDGGAIWSTMAGYRSGTGMLNPIILALAWSPRWELRGTDLSGERLLADVAGIPACATELDTRGTLCVDRSPNGSHVWRAASAKSLERIADLPPALDLLRAEGSDRVVAAERFGTGVAVLDVATRQGTRLTLPATESGRVGARWTADVVARGGYLLVLSTSRDGATVTRYVIR